VASGFRRTRSGVKARLAPLEVGLLQRVLTDLLDLLGEGPSAKAGQAGRDPLEELAGVAREAPPTPDDPALARLLPDGYRDDPEAAAELRRLTEGTLRETKRAAARGVLEDLATVPDGGVVEVATERGELWLAALNDVRLALGTRLDVTEDLYEHPPELAEDDPRAAGFALYDWLTWLQETLVQALAGW
jgi:hypothetical protein